LTSLPPVSVNGGSTSPADTSGSAARIVADAQQRPDRSAARTVVLFGTVGPGGAGSMPARR